jgi:hypothetical protein
MMAHPNGVTPELCAVCARSSAGIGYSPNPSSTPPIWFCDDPGCLSVRSTRYAMKQETLSKLEASAMITGGDVGGAYLDSIGKTDLGDLEQAEWEEFLRHVITGYRAELARQHHNFAAPF